MALPPATLEITRFFDDPLYSGASTVDPSICPSLFPIAIAGHPYKVDWPKSKRGSVPVLRDAADTTALPSEASLSTQGRWTRYGLSWFHGAGQIRFDADTRTIIEGRVDDRQRFYTSKGLNVWTESQLTLLPDTAQRLAATGTNLKVLQTAAKLYVIDNQTLKFAADPTSGSWTTVTGTPAAALNDMTTDGTSIYLATDSGIYSGALSGTSVAIVGSLSAAYQAIGAVNGRLIAGKANVLEDIAAAGTEAAVFTHRNTSFVFTSIWAGPNRFYAAGGTTSNSEVFQVGIKDDATLMPARLATPIMPGELVRQGVFHVSLCILVTSKGIRLADADVNGGLTYGPVISAPGDVRCVFGEDRFVYFGWTNLDATSTGVGRAALDVFPTGVPLVPAYASDLMATTQGTVLSVARYGGRTYFAVSGVGIYGDHSTNVVASGTLNTGWISYGTVEKKAYLSVDVRHSSLNGGQIRFDYIDDTGTATFVGSNSTVGSTGPQSPLPMDQPRRARIQLLMTVSQDSATVSPIVYQWTLLALPIPQRAERIQLALVFRDVLKVGTGEGQPWPFDCHGEYQYLLNFAASGQIVQYQQGVYNTSVRVEAVEIDPENMTEDLTDVQGTCLVSLVTT